MRGKQSGNGPCLHVGREPATVFANELLEEIGLQVDAQECRRVLVLLGDDLIRCCSRLRRGHPHHRRVAHSEGKPKEDGANGIEEAGLAQIRRAHEEKRVVRRLVDELRLEVRRARSGRFALGRQ